MVNDGNYSSPATRQCAESFPGTTAAGGWAFSDFAAGLLAGAALATGVCVLLFKSQLVPLDPLPSMWIETEQGDCHVVNFYTEGYALRICRQEIEQ